MLLDSGASCSVVSKSCIHSRHIESIQSTRLINADGRDVTTCGVVTMTVELGQFSTNHKFLIVDFLSTPVILGCDCLIKHGYIIDFEQCTFYRTENPDEVLQLQPTQTSSCHMITLDDELPQAIHTTCTGTSPTTVNMPVDVHPALIPTLQNFKSLISTELGKTYITEHTINTGEASPIKVPPRAIPFHYAERVHQQLQEVPLVCPRSVCSKTTRGN